MRNRILCFLFIVVVLCSASKVEFDSLPQPVSNNAVAALKSGRHWLLFSLMGIGRKKSWDAITSAAYALDTSTGKWTELNPVPGTGRIAAVAVGARDKVFLFGGYVVDAQGNETTVPDVNVLEVHSGRWYRGADIPIPVDDSFAGVYHDRYIYLVSGWSKNDAVRNVQMYDIEKDTWIQLAQIPGTAVFGHAGGILYDTIVYVDGARRNPSGDKPKYIPSDECWLGRINAHDPTKIEWSKLPNHPGAARYRIAAGSSDTEGKIFFYGGTGNPYNFNGIGYDGRPSAPSPVSFAYRARTGKWELIDENVPEPTMDHRGLLVTPQGLMVLGGMTEGQSVTEKVQALPMRPRSK